MTSLSEIRKSVTTWYDTRRDFLDDVLGTDHPAVVVAILGGVGLAASAVVAGLYWLCATVIKSVTDLLDHLAADVHNSPEIQNAVRLVTDPITSYLSTHAAGTGLSTSLLAHTWLAVGGILILLAFLESQGARIGWILYGAATVAMVWYGTDWVAHRPVAAGITGLTWTLISIGILHRIGQRPATIIVRNIVAPPTNSSSTPTSNPDAAPVTAFRQDTGR